MIKIKAEKLYNKYLKKIEKQYGNKETNNIQLDKIGKHLFKDKYIGTFSSDKIPIMKKHQYAIINLDDSRKLGSHWVGLIKENDKSLIYDSFGRKTYKILPELLNSGNGIIKMTERDVEQRDIEQNCGQRVLSWIYVYHKHGWNFAKWI